ncbi:hypothetical protein HPB47_022594, partial [Ixodes persulcatus]
DSIRDSRKFSRCLSGIRPFSQTLILSVASSDALVVLLVRDWVPVKIEIPLMQQSSHRRELRAGVLSGQKAHRGRKVMAAPLASSESPLADEFPYNAVGTSSVITESQEESRHMSSAILQSKKLLTKYGRREMTDRVLILLAVVFFFACVLYVLKRRLF